MAVVAVTHKQQLLRIPVTHERPKRPAMNVAFGPFAHVAEVGGLSAMTALSGPEGQYPLETVCSRWNRADQCQRTPLPAAQTSKGRCIGAAMEDFALRSIGNNPPGDSSPRSSCSAGASRGRRSHRFDWQDNVHPSWSAARTFGRVGLAHRCMVFLCTPPPSLLAFARRDAASLSR
jgi:hypothetical protein